MFIRELYYICLLQAQRNKGSISKGTKINPLLSCNSIWSLLLLYLVCAHSLKGSKNWKNVYHVLLIMNTFFHCDKININLLNFNHRTTRYIFVNAILNLNLSNLAIVNFGKKYIYFNKFFSSRMPNNTLSEYDYKIDSNLLVKL